MHEITSSGLLGSIKPDPAPRAPLQPKHPRQGLLIDCAIAAAYVALVAAWSLIIPFNGAPDEMSHMFLVEYLVRFGSMPEPQVEPVVPFVGVLTGVELQKTMIWYHGLPFAHTLGAAAFAELFSQVFPKGSGYLAARLFNWVLGGVFILGLMRALRWSGLQGPPTRLIALAIATIPQVTFVFGYFNHDAFGLAAVTLGLHAFLRLVKYRGSVRIDATYFGVACGLILLSKPYHYPALVFFVLMLPLFRWTDPAFPLRSIATRAIATAILISAPILVFTFVKFGDVSGAKMTANFLSVYPPRMRCYLLCPTGLIDWSEVGPWVWINFQSFFGVLGWMNLYLPESIYRFWFLPLVILFGVLAVIFIVKRTRTYWSRNDRAALFDASFVTLTILMLLGTAILSLGASQTLAPQPQGRYLFLVLPFVAYCIALFAIEAQSTLAAPGSDAGSVASNHEPSQPIVLGVLATLTSGMLFFNIYAALFVLAPAYRYGPGRVGLGVFSNDIRLDFDALTRALSVAPAGLNVTIPLRGHGVQGVVDSIVLRSGGRVTIEGWAFDTIGDRPAAAVMIVHKGIPIQVARVGRERRDAVKATSRPAALHSGFRVVFPRGDIDTCATEIFAVTSSLDASKLRLGKNVCPR